MLTIDQYNEKYYKRIEEHSSLSTRIIIQGMLQFTPETARCWGGSYEGDYVQFVLRDYSNSVHPLLHHKGKKLLDVYAEAEKERKEKALRRSEEFHSYLEDPSWEYPIKLHISGNDDTSYSKCYKTEQDAMNEINLFIDNEPLDFHDIIQGFNFIFTN